MYDHYNDVHSNDMDFDPYTNFSFDIIQKFRDPLTRQLNEAARIQSAYNGVHIDLNNRGHPIGQLPRVSSRGSRED